MKKENQEWIKFHTSERNSGDYYVNRKGVVKKHYSIFKHKRSKERVNMQKTIKGVVSKNGYFEIKLTKEGKRKTIKIHRLVALAFIPNPQNLPQVNHIDGNKLNNNIDNLEWCDNRRNCQHAYDIGLNVSRKGESHGRSILTEKKVLAIRRLHSINPKTSRTALSKKLNTSISTISHIINRRIWSHI